ncbi:GntR family transcriptional regulator [Cuneatibacter caecimuris]|uniref:GntR family transcriptional regulator n=1 Tax=Cuneatibacter caecimuris TaxID=1796618 RepID=A0A4Q7PL78_9FIRM|nr:GntR family transcriptional regulator [Cuneatibacter caecimuris]RZT00621.1 GntR family transcriptional regulator [Cuneatibacter caecimuris]
MRIVLSYQSGVPIYEQIKDQIKASILSGELCEDDPLPSLRQLARDLKVSLITTTRAYGDLELEGFVHTMPGKGVYVKKVNTGFIREQHIKEVNASLKNAVRHGKLAGLSMEAIHELLDSAEEDGE